jgi:hypothetical protein
MGHCRKSGYALWATVADLGMRYGPLRRKKPTLKICGNFRAVGHGVGFGFAL